MCCITCFRTSNGWKKSWKCWEGKSSEENETTRKRKQRGFLCCICGGRRKDEERLPNGEESSKGKGSMCCFNCNKSTKDANDEELTRERLKCGMGCFICGTSSQDEEPLRRKGKVVCDESSKDEKPWRNCEKSSEEEELSGKKGESGSGCFICGISSEECKDAEPTRKRLKCGMDCLICGKSSEDKESLRRKGKGVCDESSEDEKRSRKCGKCVKGYCNCDRSSKDEELLGKKGESGTGCFDCDKSSKYEELSGKKGKCGMGFLTCGKPPEDEESSRKKGKCGMACFCRSGSRNKENHPKKKGKCGMGCSTCGNSSEDEESPRKRGKCGMACFCCCGSPNEEILSQKGGNCGNCFNGNKRSLEDPSRKKDEGCVSCFSSFKPSKEEVGPGNVGDMDTIGSDGEPPKRKCGMGCFTCGKPSEDEESPRKKGKHGMACFCCSGSRTEENLSRKGGKCGNCFNGKKRSSSEHPSRKKVKGCTSCFCGFKPSKEEEGPGKVGDRDTSGPSGEPSKRKCATGASCLCCCLHCCTSRNKNADNQHRSKMFCWKTKQRTEINHLTSLVKTISFNSASSKKRSQAEEILRIGSGNITTQQFTYYDLAEATQNFAPQCLLGTGGFGKVYKGQLKSTNQTIAVKKLDRSGYQGDREFLVEVLMLSVLGHQNLVNMIGYCADGHERILVYDYMSRGSLQDHLFDLSPNSKPLDWKTRMKIAAGAARGLEHLHDTANPPVIYRDLKSSNILLDENYNPRLADFGLAKLGPVGDKNHVSTRVMGTYGYCAPEYALTGRLTTMSDIYSYGVVLLELITGRKAMDFTRPRNEQRLVDWVTPRFQDRKNFVQLADPLLEGKFPVKALFQALAVATMCLQEEETTRPRIKDVLFALQFLAMPEKPAVPNKLPAELPRETYSTSTCDWQSGSDQ